MIRTQVQLTEAQWRALHELARRRGVSISELVRAGVDRVILESARRLELERALALIGKYRAEPGDVAERHDDYLADASDPRLVTDQIGRWTAPPSTRYPVSHGSNPMEGQRVGPNAHRRGAPAEPH